MNKDRFVVLIPAFNEEPVIGGLVASLRENGFNKILVINDGSLDKTSEVSSKMGANVLSHKINLGVGAALRTGFKYIIDTNLGDYVITMDADGQHLVEDVLKIVEQSNSGCDVVNGERIFNAADVPFVKKIINVLADIFVFFLTGKYIKDTQTGLRCIKVNSLKKLKLLSADYSINSELIIEALKANMKIDSVKIKAIYTNYSMSKGKRQQLINSFGMIKRLLT